jgi:excisionase family DNA binding protein
MDTETRDAVRPQAPRNEFRLFNTDEAAEILRQSRRAIQKAVADRELGHVKLGKSLRFTLDDLMAYVEKNRLKARGWKNPKGCRP